MPDSSNICTRTLHALAEGPPVKVEASIFTPEFDPARKSWSCCFCISGIGSGIREFAYGEDAFQALTIAIQAIGKELDATKARWSWSGEAGPYADFHAFPRYLPDGYGSKLASKIESVVADEMSRLAASGELRDYYVEAGMRAQRPSIG